MQYEEVQPISRKDAENAFNSKDTQKITNALLGLTYYNSDWRWIQKTCLEYVDFQDPQIQCIAVTCLGHLARIHGKLDVEQVVPILKSLSHDSEIAGSVEDALDDIQMFVIKKLA